MENREFLDNKSRILSMLERLKKFDDAMADEQGINHYTIIDVGLDDGWIYVRLDVEGRQFNHLESGLHLKVLDFLRGIEPTLEGKKYYPASLVPSKWVDYIFHGTGYCSRNTLYKC